MFFLFVFFGGGVVVFTVAFNSHQFKSIGLSLHLVHVCSASLHSLLDKCRINVRSLLSFMPPIGHCCDLTIYEWQFYGEQWIALELSTTTRTCARGLFFSLSRAFSVVLPALRQTPSVTSVSVYPIENPCSPPPDSVPAPLTVGTWRPSPRRCMHGGPRFHSGNLFSVKKHEDLVPHLTSPAHRPWLSSDSIA